MMSLSKKRAYLLKVSSQRLFAQAQVTVTMHTQSPPGILQTPMGLGDQDELTSTKAHAAQCAEY